MILGYARVSTAEQSVDMQVKALTESGAERVFVDIASGTRANRPELERLLDHLRSGDVLIVWKLDRLSRSILDLNKLLERIEAKGAVFKSMTESLDTSGAAGRMMLNLLGVFAQYEREIIVERTRAGQVKARERGAVFGRPSKLTQLQTNQIIKAITAGQTAAEMARLFKVHPSTITRLIQKKDKKNEA